MVSAAHGVTHPARGHQQLNHNAAHANTLFALTVQPTHVSTTMLNAHVALNATMSLVAVIRCNANSNRVSNVVVRLAPLTAMLHRASQPQVSATQLLQNPHVTQMR